MACVVYVTYKSTLWPQEHYIFSVRSCTALGANYVQTEQNIRHASTHGALTWHADCLGCYDTTSWVMTARALVTWRHDWLGSGDKSWLLRWHDVMIAQALVAWRHDCSDAGSMTSWLLRLWWHDVMTASALVTRRHDCFDSGDMHSSSSSSSVEPTIHN